MNITRKLAKSISYGSKRSKESIKYIVFHYTGNERTQRKRMLHILQHQTHVQPEHIFLLIKKVRFLNLLI